MVKVVHRCGIVGLTGVKKDALDTEYSNLQTYLKTGSNLGLYSANKPQADRYYRKKKKNEYPLSIRNDLLKLDTDVENTLYHFWARLPMKKIKGGMWVALSPHKPIDLTASICESKVKRKKDGNYELHLVMEKDVEPAFSQPRTIISVDLGSRNPATSVEFATGRTYFPYAKTLRQIRGHYYHLRKTLGQKKSLKTIKKIGQSESRKVDDTCHKISREIVNHAKEQHAVIAIGMLQGVRKKKRKWISKNAKRKIHSMPSYKLAQMIRYKAEQEGIPVIETYEGYTSITCNRCGSEGVTLKPYQQHSQFKIPTRKGSNFKCPVCGYEDNSDRNGSINIGNRVSRYICDIGASVNTPELEQWNQWFHKPTLEATHFNGW